METQYPEYQLPRSQTIVKKDDSPRPTSSELASLWASYMESSLKVQTLRHFQATVDDPEISDVLEYTANLGQKHLKRLGELYALEGHAMPRAFSDEDVYPDAPRLFTDSFILAYLLDIAMTRMDGYSAALQMSTRADIRKYFTECLADPAELYNRVVNIMLARGIYSRPPYLPPPSRVYFAKKPGRLSARLGKQGPLDAIEIAHIFNVLRRNTLRKSLFTGFGRVTRSGQVRRYLAGGLTVCNRHIERLSSLLIKNGFPVSMTWDPGITNSNTPPYSDRLMLQNARASNVILVHCYGRALSVLSMRYSNAIMFGRMMAEAGRFGRDGVNMLIKKGWFEQPPGTKGAHARDNKLLH